MVNTQRLRSATPYIAGAAAALIAGGVLSSQHQRLNRLDELLQQNTYSDSVASASLGARADTLGTKVGLARDEIANNALAQFNVYVQEAYNMISGISRGQSLEGLMGQFGKIATYASTAGIDPTNDIRGLQRALVERAYQNMQPIPGGLPSLEQLGLNWNELFSGTANWIVSSDGNYRGDFGHPADIQTKTLQGRDGSPLWEKVYSENVEGRDDKVNAIRGFYNQMMMSAPALTAAYSWQRANAQFLVQVAPFEVQEALSGMVGHAAEYLRNMTPERFVKEATYLDSLRTANAEDRFIERDPDGNESPSRPTEAAAFRWLRRAPNAQAWQQAQNNLSSLATRGYNDVAEWVRTAPDIWAPFAQWVPTRSQTRPEG